MIEPHGRLLLCCSLQCKVLEGLDALSQPYHSPSLEQCADAATCYHCHGDDGGIPGTVCGHCQLAKTVTKWETRLWQLSAKSKHANAVISEKEAVEQYHNDLLGFGAQAGAAAMRGGMQDVQLKRVDNEHVIVLKFFLESFKCATCLPRGLAACMHCTGAFGMRSEFHNVTSTL